MLKWLRKRASRTTRTDTPPQIENLIDDLEETLAHGSVARRVETLQRVTDLFVTRATDYSEELVDVFDDVYEHLTREIETSAKAILARRLAPIPNAPRRTIRRLAFDEAIEVAGSVLTLSPRLSDDDLINNVMTCSQDHMMAISRRKELSPAVTDALVEHGDANVVHSTASNPGASFSEIGYSRLVERAHGDDRLATCICRRRDIPRHHFLKLLARASDATRAKLQAINPAAAREIAGAVEAAANEQQSTSAATSSFVNEAARRVELLHKGGQLDENHLMTFIKADEFEAVSAALARMIDLPPAVTELMLVEQRSEGIFVIAKALGLSWPTVSALFKMRGRLNGSDNNDITMSRASYERLRLNTAQQVLRFYRMRQNATISFPAPLSQE
jgi:uncharacterized protein (DUF2336 family)